MLYNVYNLRLQFIWKLQFSVFSNKSLSYSSSNKIIINVFLWKVFFFICDQILIESRAFHEGAIFEFKLCICFPLRAARSTRSWKCGFPLILHHTGDVTAAQSSVQYASIVGNRLRKCCQSEVGLVYSRKEMNTKITVCNVQWFIILNRWMLKHYKYMRNPYSKRQI